MTSEKEKDKKRKRRNIFWEIEDIGIELKGTELKRRME